MQIWKILVPTNNKINKLPSPTWSSHLYPSPEPYIVFNRPLSIHPFDDELQVPQLPNLPNPIQG